MSTKTFGGILVSIGLIFGGVLYYTVRSLTAQSQALGCMANTPGCMQTASYLSASHMVVGFLTAVVSMGVYFFVFHRDQAQLVAAEQKKHREREEHVALLSKVMTPGERALLRAVVQEEGIAQSTLSYRTNLTPGRVSQILSQFEEQGLVSRRAHGKTYKVYYSA